MSNSGFCHPIIGQEAICPDGLGRVVAYEYNPPHRWIQVSTYVNDRGCKWAPENVKLVKIGPTQPAAIVGRGNV
ncbi:hypothetical protein TPMD04_54 [Thiohalocapsa phage LS06-2018-MD04]|jgi:hypothetical protein|nr:hypothetical protein TPMD04_54 [Thiohalocapsa phage LS06-2018-MD04]